MRYRISASSNPARDVNGVQSSVDFGVGSVGGEPGGRKFPWQSQGIASMSVNFMINK